MAIIKDPEGRETTALHAMVDFKDMRVLEIGCGNGRLTWRYAENAKHVTAIDPDGNKIEAAKAQIPERLKSRIRFLESTLADFVGTFNDIGFDVAIFSWSL